MSDPALAAADRLPFTFAGMVEGARLCVPFLPGILVYAAAVGAASADKGLTMGEAVLMSFSVFAGASQLMALQIWPQALTPAAMATLVVVTLAVNLRFLLMSASLQPWLAKGPQGPVHLGLAMITDASFLVGARYSAKGGRDVGVVVGAGLFMWLVWTLATVPGYRLGYMLTDPRKLAIDMLMPVAFTAMAVGLVRLKRDLWAWPAAAGVALITAWLVEGYWFIISGALAGSLVAGALHARQ